MKLFWEQFVKNRIVKFLASLKLAVCLILIFTALMVWGTLTESAYNAQYAQWRVYLSPVFIAVECLLFINILFATLVRLPFRRRLSGFYMIHAGLLTILIGAALTALYGLDGSVRLFPHKPTNTVVIREPTLYLFYNAGNHVHPAEFVTPLPRLVGEYRQKDRPYLSVFDYDVYLERFLPFASPRVSWRPHPDKAKKSRFIQLKLKNAMFTQDVELSTLQDGQTRQQLGPLTLVLVTDFTSTCFEKAIRNPRYQYIGQSQGDCRPITAPTNQDLDTIHKGGMALLDLAPLRKGPHVVFFKNDRIGYGKGSDWEYAPLEVNKPVTLPWMGFQLTAMQVIDDQYRHVEWDYNPPRRDDKRHFAAYVTLKNRYNPADTQSFWIDDTGLKRVVTRSGFAFDLMVGNKLYHLPFALELKRFKMDTNPGTDDPASYESFVNVKTVAEVTPAHIFMNNPLKRDKYTFYQASYFELPGEDAFGSVLSVNYDPGRPIKYGGSILLVLGTIIHFTIRSVGKRKV